LHPGTIIIAPRKPKTKNQKLFFTAKYAKEREGKAGDGRREKGERNKEQGEKPKAVFHRNVRWMASAPAAPLWGQGRCIQAQSSLLPGNLKPKT